MKADSSSLKTTTKEHESIEESLNLKLQGLHYLFIYLFLAVPYGSFQARDRTCATAEI